MVEKHIRRNVYITKTQDKWLDKQHPQKGSELVRKLLDKEMKK
jgi:hypothetical protein